jgi:hypothetical protein
VAQAILARLSPRLAFHVLSRFLLARSIRFFRQDVLPVLRA